MATTTSVEMIREAQRASGAANILAIGTANPPNFIDQADYPDFYFRVTKSENKPELKQKLKRFCERSMIKKRHFYLTEEILENNPTIYSNTVPSYDIRTEILKNEIPNLGKEAALKAIKEWGRPISDITHLVFAASSATTHLPNSDYALIDLLGLQPNVRRFMLLQHGCYAGGAALRLAKDQAENNAGARVLVVCSENMTVSISSPCEDRVDMLVGQALFADGASAVIVGADPNTDERPLFQMVSAAQTLVPGSKGALEGLMGEMGPFYVMSHNIPSLIGNNIEKIFKEALAPLGISDWNSVFYVIHPGGPAILNKMEEKLGLEPHKLNASRVVLREYGNMWGATLGFVIDEMRKNSIAQGKATTGDGLEWGVLAAFGPSLTMETIILKSVAV